MLCDGTADWQHCRIFLHVQNSGAVERECIQFNEDRLASIVRSAYTALQGESLATAQRSSSSAHTSVEDELRSRFQTPRVPVTGGSPSLHATQSRKGEREVWKHKGVSTTNEGTDSPTFT